MIGRKMKSIKLLLIAELLILGLLFYSFAYFMSFQIATLSALLIMLGSMYSYNALITRRLGEEIAMDDGYDKIEDPYELYDEEEPQDGIKDDENLDLGAVVKEERARLKANKNTYSNVKQSSPALVSVFRLVPYVFLVLGFIGIKNNNLLELPPFLIGLALGIFLGYKSGSELFKTKEESV